MTRDEFERRFREAVQRAAALASEQIGHPVSVPGSFEVLVGALHDSRATVGEVIDRLYYLGPDRFRVFIDGQSTSAAIELERDG